MPKYIIGFQKISPTADSADAFAYFNYQTDSEHPDGVIIESVTRLMLKAYPNLTSFPEKPEQVDRTYLEKYFLNLDRANCNFVVKAGSFYEIHSGIKTFPAATLTRITHLPLEDNVDDADISDTEKLDSIFRMLPLESFHKFIRLNLTLPDEAIEVNEPDENILTPLKPFNKSTALIDDILEKNKLIQQKYTETAALLDEIESKEDSTCLELLDAEIKANAVPFAELLEQHRIQAAQLDQQFEDLMDGKNGGDELNRIRFALIKCLWICALHFAQEDYDFNKAPNDALLKYNNIFADDLLEKIAFIEMVDSKPAFRFNDKLASLNFTQLENLVNIMLKKFQQQASIVVHLGLFTATKIAFFRDLLLKYLPSEAYITQKEHAFKWNWNRFIPRSEEIIDSKTENSLLATKFANLVTQQTEILLKLTTLHSSVHAKHAKEKAYEKQTSETHQSIADNISAAKDTALTMRSKYQQANTQINSLHELLTNLLAASAKFTLPYAELEELISQADTIIAAMEVNKAAADAQQTELFIATSQQIKIAQSSAVLKIKFDEFERKTEPLARLNNLITSLQTSMASPPKVSSNDNLIIVTRKFANMLADIEYFQAQVKWGGGEAMLVNGRTYTVPASYKKLYNLIDSLKDPLSQTNAKAFWTSAKAIVDQADRRTAYRYLFFKVRSDEMQELLNLVKAIDVDNVPAPDHFDSQLNKIKSNWQQNQEPGAIKMKGPVQVSPASLSRSLSLSSSSFLSASAAAASTDSDDEQEDLSLNRLYS